MGSITKAAVDTLKPGAILWDDDLKGFGIRRREAGGAYYFLKYRRAKRQRWVTIGRHGSPWTAATARKRALVLLGHVADEHTEDPAVKRDWEGALPTVKEFSEEYIERHARKKKKPRSVTEDERNLKLHILPAFGTIRIDVLTTRDVAKFHSDRSAHEVNANRCLSLLSHMCRIAEKWGYRPVASNPCRDVARYDEVPRERYLSAAELARLGKALKKVEDEEGFTPYALGALRVLLFTGARKSEITTLEWDHVDMARGVARRETKTGMRNIYLPAPALAVLKGLAKMDGSPYVFPSIRDPKRPLWDIENAWRAVRKEAKLADVHLHDLRHAFASVAAAGGDSLVVIGAVLGHKHAATTQRYAHLSTDPLLAAADATAKRIESAMGIKRPRKNVRQMGGRR